MYEKLTDFTNIYNAYKAAASCKHSKYDVIRYENNLHMYLWNLKERLENYTYQIGGYHKFMIYDPKEREIQALSFEDRVFQHLLCDNVLMPYFEARLIYDNAACRRGKGTHFAMNRLTRFLREHYKRYGCKGYALKFDIRKYFESIDHEVLKKKLCHFPDEDVKLLLYQIIDSFNKNKGKGLPMGNQSSQWFAIYYLDRLDRLIKERFKIKHYVRYMDDGILVHHDKEYLKSCLYEMRELVEEDRLEFNEKTQIFPLSQGVDFVGWHFYLKDTGKVIRKLRTSAKKRLYRNVARIKRGYEKGDLSLDDVKMSLYSYEGHLSHGHTYLLREKVKEKLGVDVENTQSSTD